MARDLSNVVSDIFVGSMARHSCWRNLSNDPSVRTKMPNLKYMTIPITDNAFEIPIFALDKLVDTIRMENIIPDTLVVPLYTIQASSRYTSLGPVMQDVLCERYKDSRLAKITVRNLEKNYYGCYGAIFNSNYEPLLLCTWQVGRTPDRRTSLGEKLTFFKPLIRVSPKCFTEDRDLVTKFITEKFLGSALSTNAVYPGPHVLNSRFLLDPPELEMPLRAVIDDMPFQLTTVLRPSINTTNDTLLNVAKAFSQEIAEEPNGA